MKQHLIALAVVCIGAGNTAIAQQPSAKPIRIAVINDQNGMYSETGGLGSVVGARLAIEDFGGEIAGRKIELIVQDHQNKPDVAAAIARKGIEVDGYDLIADGASSAAGLAINEVAKQRKTIFVVSGPAAPDFSGKACASTTFHFTYDTYALANGTAKAVVKNGGDSWFFITADYAFGHSIQRDVTRFVEEATGKVLGAVRFPTGSPDLSSYLLQAQASKAKIIGLATAGTDTINALKQGQEFAIVQGGQNFAGLLVFISDVHAMGLEAAKGLILTTSFYWDLDEKTRKLSDRFVTQMGGRKPTMVHAGVYSGVRHYLAAVKAAATTDSEAVAKVMRTTPVNDAYNTNVAIRADGRVLHDMHLMKVKSPSESKGPYDYYSLIATTPGKEAFRPLDQSECPLVPKG